MSAVEDYLKNLARSFPRHNLTEAGRKLLNNEEKADWIVRILLRKEFRKAKVFEQTKQDIKNKVLLSIREARPLHFVILFGGYKHFWNSSYPEVDWAELFNLNFMSELFSPILEVHTPGIVLDYGSEDIIITMMDNYPKSALDKYAESFELLLRFYSKYCPPNLKINYIRTGEKYDSKKLKAKVKEKLPEKLKAFEKLPMEDRKRHLHRSYRSIMWKGQEDWTTLNEKEKENKLIESKIIEDTFYEVEAGFLGDYFTGDNRVPLVLSWGLSDENVDHWLTLGSTHASTVDFWIGRGILEDKGNGHFVPRVLSQKQYEEVKSKLKNVKIGFIPLKNLQSVEVHYGKLGFSNS